MEQALLGRTGLHVSRICLGTMTFGEQNTAAEAFRQLDMAVAGGVTMIDAAEMYPIPPRADTQGRTEAIVGEWLTKRRNRADVIVATKITGPGAIAGHIRGGDLRFGRSQIRDAIDASLARLRSDYIDLYQLHWPERPTNRFGQHDYVHDSSDFTPFEEVLAALSEEIADGRIRAVGLSNETPWGLMAFVGLADRYGHPRMASIQNPYSLLNRLFEVGLAEVALRESCGLLAYSPLAFGMLTGKYLDGARPDGARLTMFPHYQRYSKPAAQAATQAYVEVARNAGLLPAQMALAWILTRPFVTSVIIGATTEAQLAENLGATERTLPTDVLEAIDLIHVGNPNPAP